MCSSDLDFFALIFEALKMEQVNPVHQLHVQTSNALPAKPTPLSPMCGWQKQETSSPKKVSTPTKKWTRVCTEEALPKKLLSF